MKLFCDFDGTLVDVSVRHYRVYSEVSLSLGGTPLDKGTYWELKRKKAKWAELLTLSGLVPDMEIDFLKKFISKIEDPAYLELDKVFPGAAAAIDAASKTHECYLVSLRRIRQNLIRELAELKIAHHFEDVLTGHSENDGYDVKISLIKNILGNDGGIIVGDTEADIVTGKELGLKTVAVTSGIRDKSFLVRLEPDYLIENVRTLPEVLQQITYGK